MAFVIANRVKETSTTTGTGTLTLAGAVTSFESFADIGNGNTTAYLIVAVDADGVPTGQWEAGIGTYTSSGTTLSRGLIDSSTGSLVNFAAGTKHVLCCDIAGYTTPLVMATTGTRAIQVADQTALGTTAGLDRGQAAVDLQILRLVSSDVASGSYSTISGGSGNRATGTHSSVGGGYVNVATGNGASVAGGLYNTASGSSSVVSGGYDNTASADSSCVPGGRGASANKYGQLSFASGKFSNAGDAQGSQFILRKATSDGTQTELFSNGSSARLTIASDVTWAFHALVVARRTDADNESAGYIITGVIDNNAGTTALVGSITKTVLAEDSAAWDVTAEADDTNDALVFKVTGEAGKTIRWVAWVQTTEVNG